MDIWGILVGCMHLFQIIAKFSAILSFSYLQPSPLRKRSCLHHSQLFPPQGPAQNYICKRYLINIYPGKDRSKPGSLWTYLGDRPRLPRVVAMSQHSEKMAPLWTSSSNLGGERCYMRSFPHSPWLLFPGQPQPPPHTLSLGQPCPWRKKMLDGRGKPSHPHRSPFLFRGVGSSANNLPTTFETTLTFPV